MTGLMVRRNDGTLRPEGRVDVEGELVPPQPASPSVTITIPILVQFMLEARFLVTITMTTAFVTCLVVGQNSDIHRVHTVRHCQPWGPTLRARAAVSSYLSNSMND